MQPKKRPSDNRDPYFWSSSSSSATELMQYRSPVGCGPSSKMCPRWASHLLHFTSVRRIPWLASFSASTASSLAAADTLVGSCRFGIFIFAGKRWFRPFSSGYKVLILRELFLPCRLILAKLLCHSPSL